MDSHFLSRLDVAASAPRPSRGTIPAERARRLRPRLLVLATVLGSALAVALLGATGWLAYTDSGWVQGGEALGDRVRAAELSVATVFSTLKDAETGQRGYLLTGDPVYLEIYTAARRRLDADFAQLDAAQLADAERPAIRRLRDLANVELAELARTVALRQAGQNDAALAVVRTKQGLQAMQAISAEVAGLQAASVARLPEAQSRVQAIRRRLEAMGVAALGCGLVAFVAGAELRARRHLARTSRLERFVRAFGAAPGMMRTPDGRIDFWSEGNERLFGYRAEEAVGRFAHELLATRFPASRAEIDAELLREGQWHGELVQRHRDGHELAVASLWVLHRGAGGEADVVIEVSSDLTSFRRADTLLRTIVESAPGLIYAKDTQGRMLLANAATLDLIGKPWSKVEGRTDMQLLDDPVQGAAVMARDRQVMQSGHAQRLEEVVGSADGHERVWLSLKTPMRDQTGAVSGLVGVSVEVTEQKRLEATLRQAQRMDAMGQLTAGVAHDFNNLLQTIVISVELLREQPGLDAEGQGCVATAASAAERGATLVHRLLAFSRGLPLKAAVLSPRRVVDDVAALLGRTLGSRIQLETKVEDAVWPVRADSAQLENCLVNLAVNARDAMPGGGLLQLMVGNLRMAAVPGQHAAGADYVCFAVRDHGIGMPPDIVARALEPFFTTKPVGKGTGLGLSMVHGFVRQSGGDVRIDSVPGQGTTVSIVLPRAVGGDASPDEAGGSGVAAEPPAPGGPTPEALASARIMVVDDDAAVRRVLTAILSKAGYRPLEAASGNMALALLQADEECHLLVTDQSMPGLTGSELLGQVAKIRPGLPTILITGYRGATDLDHLKGRVAVLHKPFKREALLGQVQALLVTADAGEPDA